MVERHKCGKDADLLHKDRRERRLCCRPSSHRDAMDAMRGVFIGVPFAALRSRNNAHQGKFGRWPWQIDALYWQ